MCGRVKDMLLPWESTLDIDNQVYLNLVRIFYSNMEISVNRLDRIITYAGGVPIEFDVEDLNKILGPQDIGHHIYTSRKTFSFADFDHHRGVRSIYRRRDLTNDICALPFHSQLLNLQVRILHTILQHIVTPKKGHSDEMARLDAGY